jgi:hypothetical protein
MSGFRVNAVSRIPKHQLLSTLVDPEVVFDNAKRDLARCIAEEILKNKENIEFIRRDDDYLGDEVIMVSLNVLTDKELKTLILEAEQRGRQDEAQRTRAFFTPLLGDDDK